jgi:hypothetical protein
MEYKVTGQSKALRSVCCEAAVRVEGETTQHYVCWACGKPCDAADVVISTTGTCIGSSAGESPDAMFVRALAATINQTGS